MSIAERFAQFPLGRGGTALLRPASLTRKHYVFVRSAPPKRHSVPHRCDPPRRLLYGSAPCPRYGAALRQVRAAVPATFLHRLTKPSFILLASAGKRTVALQLCALLFNYLSFKSIYCSTNTCNVLIGGCHITVYCCGI